MAFTLTDSKEKIKHARMIVAGAAKRDYFTQFQGQSEDNIVLMVPESKREASTVTAFIVSDLVGTGVSGNQDLSENRDELNFVPFTFKGDLIANSIKSPVQKIMDRTSAGNWRREKTKALQNWLYRKTTRHKFYALSDACTNVVAVKADDSITNDTTTLAAGDTFDTRHLDEMLDRAKNGWNDGVRDYPELVPYTIERKTTHGVEVVGDFFPVFVGPQSLKSLKKDPVFIAEQEAKAKGGMFSSLSGFAGVYDSAIIIEVPKDTPRRPGIIRSDSEDFGKYTGFTAQYGATVDNSLATEINLMVGCGAAAMGFDEFPNYDEDPTEDNGRKVVAYIEEFFGFEKVRWKGETAAEQASIYHDVDYGVIAGIGTIN